jgi:tripartite-type tricarboxylate transporter receptor subunit TctC
MKRPGLQRYARSLLLAVVCIAAVGDALAQAYPVRPITLVVAGPPAGGTDLIARLIGADLAQSLGQPVIIENRAGAAGIIGSKMVAHAAPDGYTLIMGQLATHAIVPALYRPRPYDPLQDFTPVGLVGTAPDILVIPSSTKATTVVDLLASGKDRPDSLTYGSPGVGLPQHIAGYILSETSGSHMRHIPYKGSAPALTDLLGGQISMMFVTPAAVVAYLKSGQLRALAQTSAKRSQFFPNLPTFTELGMPAVEEVGWFGILAPAKTPSQVIQKLGEALGKSMAKPRIRQALEAMYVDPAGDSSPQAFAAFLGKEVPKWDAKIQQLGIHIN